MLPAEVADTATPSREPPRAVSAGAVETPPAAKPTKPDASDESTGAARQDTAASTGEPAEKAVAPARLSVEVFPWGEVWINGRRRGTAPLKNIVLKPGRYRVAAGRDSPTETRVVRLRPGQRDTVRFDLTDASPPVPSTP
ncbi:MAG: hypothetical protein WBG86_01770, partial [Polyangiales bacterium]